MNLKDLQQRVIELERATRSTGSQMVRVAMAPSGSIAGDEAEGNGTGGSGCCCNEFDCLRLPGMPAAFSIKPAFYEFTPAALLCDCDPPARAQSKVQLYQVDAEDDTVWESLHGDSDNPFQCLVKKLITVTCTATWEWVAGAPCGGECTYICQTDPALPFTFRWQRQSDTCDDGCDCEDKAVDENVDGTPCNIGNNGITRTINGCFGGFWQLVEVDIPDCTCTPPEPDFDGSTEGQTATTTCDSTVESDTETELAVAFWRLTIVSTLDYYGCDQTKLEFIVGTNVMFTHYLQDRCGKRFCRICTSTFRVSACPPLCEAGPTTICLKPKLPDAVECPVADCGFPVLLAISDLTIVPTLNNVGLFPPFYPGDINVAWGGDHILGPLLDEDGVPVPCNWRKAMPTLSYYPALHSTDCVGELVYTRLDITGYLYAYIAVDPSLGPGHYWISLQLQFGFVQYARDDVPPCYEKGDFVADSGRGVASAGIDPGLGTHVDNSDDNILQVTDLPCTGELVPIDTETAPTKWDMIANGVNVYLVNASKLT